MQKTQIIELCDHYEYWSDQDEVDGNNGEDTKNNPLDIEIPCDETQGGYQSGPENLEHSAIMPILCTNQPQLPQIIGKKRMRQKKKKEDSAVDGDSSRKKRDITNCEHPDREFYAKGMCKNCYHKHGRNKPATCCASKKMYAKSLCQNCYMKQYGKGKRIENKIAKKGKMDSCSAASSAKASSK